MSQYATTPNLGLFKPTYRLDAGAWGLHWNANADKLDQVLGPNGPFLPLTGGVLSGPGNLVIQGTLSVAGATSLAGATMAPGSVFTLAGDPQDPLEAATKQYVDGGGGSMPGGGPFLPLAGGVLNGPGNLGVQGTLTVTGATTLSSASVSGEVVAQSFMSTSGIFYVAGNNAYFMARGSDGHWRWTENSAVHMELDNAGTLTLLGGLSCVSVIASNTVQSNFVNASNTVTSNYVHGNVIQASADGTMQMYAQDPSNRIFAFSNDWKWLWANATADLTWEAYSVGAFITFTASAPAPSYRGINWLGPWQGNGAYIATSDERLKQDVAPTTVGLAEVLGIVPIEYRREGSARTEIGFSAQQLAPIIPQAVLAVGTADPEALGSLKSVDPILGITTDTILAAVVNAMKAMDARMTALEGKR